MGATGAPARASTRRQIPVISTVATALPASTQLWTQQQQPASSEPAPPADEAPTTPLTEPVIEGEAEEHAEHAEPPSPSPPEEPAR